MILMPSLVSFAEGAGVTFLADRFLLRVGLLCRWLRVRFGRGEGRGRGGEETGAGRGG